MLFLAYKEAKELGALPEPSKFCSQQAIFVDTEPRRKWSSREPRSRGSSRANELDSCRKQMRRGTALRDRTCALRLLAHPPHAAARASCASRVAVLRVRPTARSTSDSGRRCLAALPGFLMARGTGLLATDAALPGL